MTGKSVAMADKDLTNILVLELGNMVSSGYCGKMLADTGADVIKIENPAQPDLAREHGPFPGDDPSPETSALFLYLNSNKRGLTLDLSVPTGQRLLHQLVRKVDVIVEAQPPDDPSLATLSYDVLSAINPQVIVVSISTYGRSGPYATFKGADILSWMGSGSGHRFLGEAGRMPLRGVWNQASHWGAMAGADAVLLALQARDRIGRGQHIDLSEAETLGQLFLGVEATVFFEGTPMASRGTQAGVPGMVKCKDGWISIHTNAPHMWEGLVKAMGKPEWAKPYHENLSDRRPHGTEIRKQMDPWLKQHTKQELFDTCQANSAPTAPLFDVADLYTDEHLRKRDYFIEIEHPVAGPLRMPGAPYIMGSGRWSVNRPAPLLGQHNEEVYSGLLGLSRDDLVNLRRASVI